MVFCFFKKIQVLEELGSQGLMPKGEQCPMSFTGPLKYSRMEIQFPCTEETFQKGGDTLQTENEDFLVAK